jgi:SagB-type dehydrogenase family enzyme
MRLRVSRLVVFHFRNGQAVCDDPVGHRQHALRPEAWALLCRYRDWAEPGTDDAELAGQLLGAGILVEEGSPRHRREEGLGPWRHWGTAATYFHLASRTHESDDFRTAAEDTAQLRGRAGTLPEPYKRPRAEAPGDRPGPHKPTGDEGRRDHAGGLIMLPAPSGFPGGLPGEGGPGLGRVLRRRRTTRRFGAEPVSLDRLATLLHWVAGVQHEVRQPGFGVSALKASPSGGARHPVEVHPVVRNVPGLPSGVYRYAPDRHALEPLRPPPTDDDVLHWCGGQSFTARAPVLLLYTAVLERTAWKYQMSRTYRALYLDLGHVSQTAYLVGTALGLGVFFTAAIRDEALERVLGLDWTAEIPLGVTGVGVPDDGEAARQEAMLHGAEPAFSYAGDDWDGMA